jgi:ABC-2 type transport system permease protein
MKRYLFNTVIGFVVLFLIFLGFFWGIKTAAGPQVNEDSLNGMVVGYVLWTSSMMALLGTGGVVLSESQKGTLEQLYLSPYGAEVIFLTKAVSSTIFNFGFITVFLFVAMLATDRWLTINLPFFYAVLFLSLLSLIGFGFMLGGVGLIHKKVGSVNAILAVGLIGLLMLPAYPLNPLSFLPFVAGAHAINKAIVLGAKFPATWYAFIAANSLVYLATGLVVFKIFERRARRLNKLEQY